MQKSSSDSHRSGSLFLGACSVLISAVSFGLWFKSRQLSILTPELIPLYPKLYWLDALLNVSLLFLLFWIAGIGCLLLAFKIDKIKTYAVWDSFSFLFLGLTPLGVPLRWALGLHLFFRLVNLVLQRSLFKARPMLQKHFVAFFLILLTQSCFKGFVSPYSWDNALHALKRGESLFETLSSPIHQVTYTNAKNFDFSGFYFNFYGGAPKVPACDISFPIQLATLLLDLPAIHPEAFARLLLIVFFCWFLLSSFGFYLFCLYGLELSFFTSLIGGVLSLVSNWYFAILSIEHLPHFSGAFLNLPFALLLLCLAFRKMRPLLGWASGATLSLTLYLDHPHPDALIQAIAFLILYYGFLFYHSGKSVPVTQKFLIGCACAVGFLLGAVFSEGPLVEALARHEFKMFGHLTPVSAWQTGSVGLQEAFIPLLKAFGLFLPLLLLCLGKKIIQAARLNSHLLFFLGISLLLYLLFVPLIGASLIQRFMELSHWHFIALQMPERVLIYLSLSLLLSCLCSFDFALQNRLRWGVSLGMLATIVLFWQSCLIWKSPKLAHNPNNCKPYLTFKSLRLMARGIPADSVASERLLQNLLISRSKSYPGLADPDALDVAYFKNKCDSDYSEFTPTKGYTFEWGINFNLVSLFEGVTSPFHRIKAATHWNFHNGLGPGFHFNEDASGFDQRYMVAYPPLNALYLAEPEYYTPESFQYQNRMPKRNHEYLTDPVLRKLHNLSGTDVLTLDHADYEKAKGVSDIEVLPFKLAQKADPDFVIVKDKRSYGLAYLAKKIHYVAPGVATLEKPLPPFKERDSEAFRNYVHQVRHFQSILLGLNTTHSAFIETSHSKFWNQVISTPLNTLNTTRVIGNKAAFEVSCVTLPCQLAFNTAAVHGWKVFQEKLPLSIQRANFAFLSVPVEAGKHLIWFEYRPSAWIWGFYVTVLSYLFLIYVTVFPSRRQ